LVTGVLEIAAAVRLRYHVEGEWLLIPSGALSVLFGLALAFLTIAGLLVIAWWVGAYAIISGAMLLGLAYRLRSLAKHTPPHGTVTV
jgi:uncharacterized membrane protein HdeD (DUF308 family)